MFLKMCRNLHLFSVSKDGPDGWIRNTGCKISPIDRTQSAPEHRARENSRVNKCMVLVIYCLRSFKKKNLCRTAFM